MSWKIVRTAHLSLGFRSSAGWLACGALVVALATPRIGCAADPERDSWQVSVIPTISLDGSIEAARREIDFSASFSDVLVDTLFREFEGEQRSGPLRIDATTRQLILDLVGRARHLRTRNEIDTNLDRDAGETFGSGSASKFTWSATAVVDLQPGSRRAFKAEYKALDFDRDRIDLRQQGPILGVSYAF